MGTLITGEHLSRWHLELKGNTWQKGRTSHPGLLGPRDQPPPHLEARAGSRASGVQARQPLCTCSRRRLLKQPWSLGPRNEPTPMGCQLVVSTEQDRSWRSPQPASPAPLRDFGFPPGPLSVSSLGCPGGSGRSESLQGVCAESWGVGRASRGHFSQCSSNFPVHVSPLGTCSSAARPGGEGCGPVPASPGSPAWRRDLSLGS